MQKTPPRQRAPPQWTLAMPHAGPTIFSSWYLLLAERRFRVSRIQQ